jgi:hypothetical protein
MHPIGMSATEIIDLLQTLGIAFCIGWLIHGQRKVVKVSKYPHEITDDKCPHSYSKTVHCPICQPKEIQTSEGEFVIIGGIVRRPSLVLHLHEADVHGVISFTENNKLQIDFKKNRYGGLRRRVIHLDDVSYE